MNFYDDLRNQGYTEEQIASILRDYAGEEDALAQQLKMAEGLTMPTPQGRQAGNIYTAANPLEHIGAALSTLGSQKQQRQVMADQKQLNLDKQRAMIDALRSGGAGNMGGSGYGLPARSPYA